MPRKQQSTKKTYRHRRTIKPRRADSEWVALDREGRVRWNERLGILEQELTQAEYRAILHFLEQKTFADFTPDYTFPYHPTHDHRALDRHAMMN